MGNIIETLKGLSGKKIVVIGDMIVDKYRIMSAKRLSPEAPVVVFEERSVEFKAGGAGNVIANLMALGLGQSCMVCVLGNDNFDCVFENSDDFVKTMPACTVLVYEDDRLTTVKERITTARQQICRIDHQSDRPIKRETMDFLLRGALEEIKTAHAIVFSDYDHGVCVKELVGPVIAAAVERGIPVIVDSKAMDTMSKYKGATIALPNMDEARLMTKLDEDFEDEHVARFLLRSMNLKAAAVTMGPNGIMLSTQEGNSIFPALHQTSTEVVDVTGAGDTVAATVAAGLVLGMPYDAIMTLANVTAGIKVRKRGVATATPEEIMDALDQYKINM